MSLPNEEDTLPSVSIPSPLPNALLLEYFVVSSYYIPGDGTMHFIFLVSIEITSLLSMADILFVCGLQLLLNLSDEMEGLHVNSFYCSLNYPGLCWLVKFRKLWFAHLPVSTSNFC